MGMNTHVIGIKPPDDKWQKMKGVYDACVSAGTSIPKEVMEFFDHESPDSLGVRVEIEKLPCTTKYHADMRDGFEVDLKKLPPDVTVIRFYNSY